MKPSSLERLVVRWPASQRQPSSDHAPSSRADVSRCEGPAPRARVKPAPRRAEFRHDVTKSRAGQDRDDDRADAAR